MKVTSKKLPKPPYFDEITENDAVPLFPNIDFALKRGFREEIFANLKQSVSVCEKLNLKYLHEDFTLPEEFIKEGPNSVTNNSTLSISALTMDQDVAQQKSTEVPAATLFPTSCRFCGGVLRAIDKYRNDGKLMLQCRRRKCLKYNGFTTDKQAKKFLSVMAKPKPPQIDFGWYLSNPVKHAYSISTVDDNPSDSGSEANRSSANIRPIIQNGDVMLRVPGHTTLVKLL